MHTMRFRTEMWIGVLVAVCWMAGVAEGEPIEKGPYVQRITPHEAVIHWVTLDGTVRFGTSDAALDKTVSQLRHHEVTLTGLQPGTVYTYNVSETEAKEGAGSFITAPDDRDTPFTFLAHGDTRTRTEVHRKVVEAMMREKKAQFILHTGDMVSDGRNPGHWDLYFEVIRPLARNVPIFYCLGNHERDSPLYFEYFALPGNERYYSFDWGGCHFVALDTNDPRLPPVRGYPGREELEERKETVERFWDEQLRWLTEDLKAHQNADFIVVFFHHPLRSTKSSRVQEWARLNERFGRMFRDFGVDLVFGGHDHNYQHHAYKGTHYVVTGGGGAPLYDIEEKNADRYTIKLAKVEHYLRVRVEGKKLTAEAVQADGTVIERFELTSKR